MGLHRQINRFGKGLGGLAAGASYRLRQPDVVADVPRVTFDVDRSIYSRYLYSFLKFFELEGCALDLRFRPETLFSMRRSEYARWILDDRMVRLTLQADADVGGAEGPRRLIPLDFRPSADPRDLEVYDVPMAQHPRMYAEGLWNQPLRSSSTLRTGVLFVGNADPAVYETGADGGAFGTIDRVTLWNRVARRADAQVVGDEGHLANPGGAVVLADTNRFGVPAEQFRHVIGRRRYFLCAPGAFMPLCHNIVEALSVGAVPIVQNTYADLLPAGLAHGENAIVFDRFDDLDAVIDGALGLGVPEQEEMSAAAMRYYESNLTPHAVVDRVLDPSVGTVRLLAGRHSVALMGRAGRGTPLPSDGT